MKPVLTIVSGGQTGADRAALDWAIAHQVPHGGWCPAGRRAEDGPLDAKYMLTETERENYRARTVRNVRDSDATMIVNLGELEGGSLETLRIAQRRGKPVQVVQVDSLSDVARIAELRAWLGDNKVGVLNVAGPRESKRPGIYAATVGLLDRLLDVVD
ncbi:MAG TPA: putative molybdenum carrier protein [Rhodanobacteraceae bacterium]|nr:putative molybdenum carrier protein [Rhodanobacteraceae bacterium]